MAHATPAQLMQFIQTKNFAPVEQEIIAIINLSSSNMNFIKLPTQQNLGGLTTVQYEQQCINAISSYANLVVHLFCHPNYRPSQSILDMFLIKKEYLEFLFTVSAWGNTDPIIEKLKLIDVVNSKKSSFSNTKKRQLQTLLALICLGSKYRLPWKHLFELAPELTMKAYIGLVSQSVAVISKSRSDDYNELLSIAAQFPMLRLAQEKDAFDTIAPFFYCSYATDKHKYAFKQWLVAVLQYNLAAWIPSELLKTKGQIARRPNSKPRVGVVLERYGRGHAMYRTFNSRIRGMLGDYELHAFIDAQSAENSDLTAFTEVNIVEQSAGLESIARMISDSNLDILFYLSIGMQQWSSCLASIRLAPIQIMAGGHPSSSFSDAIDYFVIPTNPLYQAELQSCVREKVVTSVSAADGIAATRHPELTDAFIQENGAFLPDDEPMIIGVNGVMRKVSYDVISACKQIASNVKKPVKFIFFSFHAHFNLSSMALRLQLQKELKHFELIGYSSYMDYMKVVARCHLLLPTFPFGGSNSNVDAMMLNKPKLFLRDNQYIYTQSDRMDWSRVGLDAEFGCNTFEELVDKAVAIIDNIDIRQQYYELMQQHCALPSYISDDQHYDSSLKECFDAVVTQSDSLCEPEQKRKLAPSI